MSEDHLSNETSISAELTETGIKAAARSRAISSFDRLLGNMFEMANAPIERRNAKTRAVAEGEVKLIEAAAQKAIERMGYDTQFADRAINANFKKLAREQENREAVVTAAIEDLRTQPPTDDQNATGPEDLSPEFVDRFESYAESASTDELRARWGKVLASEIRAPGTFNRKVLRATDELDSKTARIFEQICQARLGRSIVKGLLENELSFMEIAALVSAGLILEPGLGQVSRLTPAENTWAFNDRRSVLVFNSEPAPQYDRKILMLDGNAPAIPVYVLTDVGFALSSILTYDVDAIFSRLFHRVRELIPERKLFALEATAEGQLVPKAISPKGNDIGKS